LFAQGEAPMWLFTRYGFYSVVCGQKSNGATDPGAMMVRARSMEHLKNLKARFPVLAKSEILTVAGRDYRWRLVVAKEMWAGIVAELAQELEWSNFKSEVTRYQGGGGSDYYHTLYEIWGIMHSLQQKAEAKPAKK